jgi:putative ABC transport system permease protein
MLSADGKTPLTVTVKGFYSGISLVGGGMYSDNSVTQALSGGHQFYVYQLILDPRQAADKLNTISAAVPGVTTFNLADITVFINDLLNNFIVMLTAIASLAMIAGLIIIANAVALAMLERRRELGILKAVGHTSRSVLSGVLVENGIIGFTGALLAMLLVALAMALLGAFVFKQDFSVAWPITVGIVLATGVICMLVAAFVAVRATRVRPLEVLRYE